MSLRSKIIRLAHQKPELRADLLHLVAKKAGWDMQTRPDRSDTQAILNTPWPSWEWQALPDDLWKYFKKVPGTIVVPLRELTPIRAREKGIANANKYMWLSYWGFGTKRKPLDLQDNGNGTFTILDGNSTFANAQRSRWKAIAGIVVEPS